MWCKIKDFLKKHYKLAIFSVVCVVLVVSLFSCQGLMNVNGSRNNVVVQDSFKRGEKWGVGEDVEVLEKGDISMGRRGRRKRRIYNYKIRRGGIQLRG